MSNELYIPSFPTSSNLDAALATSIPDFSKTITDNVLTKALRTASA